MKAAIMREVVVHIYDATNSGSEEIDNRFHKDGIGPIVGGGGGGVFHSAIQVIIVSSDVSLYLLRLLCVDLVCVFDCKTEALLLYKRSETLTSKILCFLLDSKTFLEETSVMMLD